MKDRKLQVDMNHYGFSYDHKWRFISYWHQIKEIMNLEPDSILEIGVGNKFVAEYIEDKGIDVTTIDIDKRLKPDITGDVTSLPLKSNSFEVVACFQVLEHIPYKRAKKGLKELKRVSCEYVLISVPDTHRILTYHVPIIGKVMIPFPRFKKIEHEYDGEHYWEIGKKEYPLKKIKTLIESVGFEIKKTYRPFEAPYHRFFVLKIS